MSESGNQQSAAPPDDTRRPPRPAVGNQVTVVLGAQWGDEGKGKVVDLLAQDADVVCRCQVGPPPGQLLTRGRLLLADRRRHECVIIKELLMSP